MEWKQINARPVCHEPISVKVITKKQPIGVKVLTGGTGGTVDLSPVYNAIASVRTGVSDNTTAITALRDDVFRALGDRLTRGQVQAMLDSIVIPAPVDLTPVQADITNLKNKDTELSNSIESLSQSQLTEAKVKALIDAAIANIVDGEEVRY